MGHGAVIEEQNRLLRETRNHPVRYLTKTWNAPKQPNSIILVLRLVESGHSPCPDRVAEHNHIADFSLKKAHQRRPWHER